MMHKASPDWASHIPILINAVMQTKGPVLELGMGISSTPLLHALCFDQDRFLLSYDNDPVYTEMFSRFRSNSHAIEHVQSWDDANFTGFWSVAFVDHKPDQRRSTEIRRLANNAEFIVVHDTEPDNDPLYHLSEVFPEFKHVTHFTKHRTHTTVLSNFHEFH